MDQLFSPSYMAGKKEYIVQPGDSLNLIAQKNQTNVDFILRLNGHDEHHPPAGGPPDTRAARFLRRRHGGVSNKTVTLRRKVGDREYFFKEYTATDIRLPPGIESTCLV
jgi:hypothetical protein